VSLLFALLAGCTPEADRSALPPIERAPVVPDVAGGADAGESRSFAMDFGGGRNGAPYGLAFFIPSGTKAAAAAGNLSDGSEGFTLVAEAPGDAVVCTDAMQVAGPVTVTARQRVAALAGASQDWHGAHAELRFRDEGNVLVEVPGTRFLPLHRVAAAGEWEEWEQRAEPPAGAKKAELCWRLVGTAGTLEVDRATFVTDGVPLPTLPPVVAVRWELDEPGPSGAPEGFDLLLPPGTKGALLDLHEGAIRFETTAAGNALACSQPVSVAPGMVFRGRVRIRELTTDAREWTGFVAEVRTYDMVGGLASPGGMPFSTLETWKAADGAWAEFESAFAPPKGSVTGKLCFRFVESTGKADVDWAAIAAE
jgi:hypothetical protein